MSNILIVTGLETHFTLRQLLSDSLGKISKADKAEHLECLSAGLEDSIPSSQLTEWREKYRAEYLNCKKGRTNIQNSRVVFYQEAIDILQKEVFDQYFIERMNGRCMILVNNSHLPPAKVQIYDPSIMRLYTLEEYIDIQKKLQQEIGS